MLKKLNVEYSGIYWLFKDQPPRVIGGDWLTYTSLRVRDGDLYVAGRKVRDKGFIIIIL